MMYTKQFISGKDINLNKYNLGIVRQPKVDDFMNDFDVIDFIKPFYLVRNWNVNGVFKDNEVPFTFFLVLSEENPELFDLLIKSLGLLYRTDYIDLVDLGEGNLKLIIKRATKKFKLDRVKEGHKIRYEINPVTVPMAFIDDSNFNYLSKVILEVSNYEEPVAEKEDDIQGDKELIELVKRKEKEYEEKQRDKNTICFEEIVRRLIHMRRCNYEDIKKLTIWQLQDTYKTYLFMDNEMLNWQFASSGNFKIKQIKKWQDETKIVRDAQN